MRKRITNLITALLLLVFIIPTIEAQKLREPYRGNQSIEKVGVMRSSGGEKTIPDVFAGRTIYGNVVWLREWNNMWEGEMPFGFYTATIDEDLYFEAEHTNLGYNLYAGTYAQGKYYGVRPAVVLGVLNGVFNYRINTNPWANEKVMIQEEASFEYLAEVMAYDETSDNIYALQYTAELDGVYWATYNKETLEFEKINKWRGNFGIMAMAGTPDGKMYCIADNGDFYEMDKVDGQPSLIGSTGVNPLAYIQSMTYDGKSGTFLWSAVADTGSALYAVNIETGEATHIMGYSQDAQLAGIYVLGNEAPAGAPAAITDLAIVYAQSGGLDGTISFTVPSKTYSGVSLSGKVNVTVFVDGEIESEGLQDPGASISISRTFTNDNHYIAVSVTNSAGMSPYNTLRTYAGYDFPVAVGDLTFEIDDTGTSRLEWTAPTEGVNNGYINPASIYYNVYRYPGNILVGNKLTACNFSETLPTEMQNYYYKVMAYNGDNKPGVEALTQAINYGEAYPVPYIQTFDNDPAAELFTIIDANEDGRTWTHASWNGEMNMNTSSYDAVDNGDWLISPRIRFEADKKYQLTFNIRGFATNYVESLRVSLGTDMEDPNTFDVTLIDMPEMAIYDFTDVSAEFIISADGDYLIGFYAYSDPAHSSIIRMTDMRVELIGDIQAPEAVTDLTIVPDANDELKATVSFTTPTLNLNDGALASLTKVYVYRGYDDTPVHTFDNPAIGSPLSWTDENVEEVGVTAYRLVGENEYGFGKFAADSVFVGVYTAPYLEQFNTPGTKDLYTFITEEEGIVIDATDWSYNNGTIQDSYWGGKAVDNWMFTPAIKLDDESVYRLKFDYSCYGQSWNKMQTSFGTTTTPDNRILIEDMPLDPYYSLTPTEQEFIIEEGGKYHLGWNLGLASDGFPYLSFAIDNISIERFTSALAPGAITDLQIIPNQQGEILVDISFKAPSVSYKNGSLSNITRIDIYRNNSGTPVKTFTDVSLGQELIWKDNDPRAGNNNYLFIAFNEHGNGRYVEDAVFVGYDIPARIQELVITNDATNTEATLTWDIPQIGANGGLLNMDALYFNVLEYDAVNQTYSVIEERVKENIYVIDRSDLTAQDYFYYGVVPVSDMGEGEVRLWYTLLGPPYELPFVESFSDEGNPSQTDPWSIAIDNIDNQYAAAWFATTGSETITPQDGDGGFVGFVNYNYGGAEGGTLSSPRISLRGMKDINLSFWLYQGPNVADTKDPYARVFIAVDNDEPEAVLEAIFIDEGDGWVQYSINLDKYKTANYIRVDFYAYAAFYYQALYFDNISITGANDVRINDVGSSFRVYGAKQSLIVEGAGGRKVDVYDVNGRLISSFTAKDHEQRMLNQGFYIVKIGKETFKTFIQ